MRELPLCSPRGVTCTSRAPLATFPHGKVSFKKIFVHFGENFKCAAKRFSLVQFLLLFFTKIGLEMFKDTNIFLILKTWIQSHTIYFNFMNNFSSQYFKCISFIVYWIGIEFIRFRWISTLAIGNEQRTTSLKRFYCSSCAFFRQQKASWPTPKL